MNSAIGAKKRKEPKRTCFLLIEPKSLCNSGEIARRLAKFRGVREVHLTSGKYGFLISANALPENVSRIASEVKKSALSLNVVISHHKYLGSKY